jgi:large exoprotein involved in heme utilization and adhesion
LAAGGVGRGGNIEVTTPKLSVTNGARLSSYTSGQGNGGDIIINARDNIKFDDAFAASTVEPTANGNAGNIKVNTGSLSLLNGGQFNASTFGQGKAGDIMIDARDAVDIDGVGSNGSSGIFSTVATTGIGKGGDITIQSGRLSVSNGLISSSSAGLGNAGDINISSSSVRLDGGAIAAQTNSTNGGNINLKAADFLLLRRGATISTTAGFASSGGNGGNITIDTPFIVAVPKENSDITANAFTGNGGNVNIRVQSIFGIEPRSESSLTSSDITASSQFGVQGQISIQEPEVQPTQGIIELPGKILDASNQIGQLCPRGAEAFRRPLSQFIVTGRGSLPPSPLQPLPGKGSIRQLASLDGEIKGQGDSRNLEDFKVGTAAIIEAQGFAKTPAGEILLVAEVPKATPYKATATAACPPSN